MKRRLNSQFYWVATFIGAVAAFQIIVLLGLGQPLWCKCGGVSPWSWEIYSSHNSQHLVDPYSLTHVLHGFIFFGALWLVRARLSEYTRLMVACVVEAAWEVFENTPMIINRYREATISLDYFGDSIANSVSDLLACMLGYWIASRLPWYWTVGILIVVEVGLLLTIKDSLLLNIIMLVIPSDAILEWQSG